MTFQLRRDEDGTPRVETFDLTPTWEGILPAYIEMIAREAAVMAGDPETLRQRRAARATAEHELRKMARLADAHVALLNAETAKVSDV